MTRHWRRESRRQQFDSRSHLGQAANVVIAKNDEERVYAAHRSAYHLNQPRTRRIRLDRFGETLDFRVIALSVSEYCVLEWSPASRGARGDRGVMQERMHRKLLKKKDAPDIHIFYSSPSGPDGRFIFQQREWYTLFSGSLCYAYKGNQLSLLLLEKNSTFNSTELEARKRQLCTKRSFQIFSQIDYRASKLISSMQTH